MFCEHVQPRMCLVSSPSAVHKLNTGASVLQSLCYARQDTALMHSMAPSSLVLIGSALVRQNTFRICEKQMILCNSFRDKKYCFWQEEEYTVEHRMSPRGCGFAGLFKLLQRADYSPSGPNKKPCGHWSIFIMKFANGLLFFKNSVNLNLL